MIRFSVLIVIIFYFNPVLGQVFQSKEGRIEYSTHIYSDNIRLKQFSIEEGLEASYIYDIAQDSLNRLWFATNLGMVIYDNQSFRYPKDKGLRQDESTSLVFNSGKLYFVTNRNHVKMHDGFRTVTIPIADSDYPTLTCLFSTKDEELLLGTRKGLYKLNKKKAVFEKYNVAGTDSAHIYDIAESLRGTIAVGTSDGVYFLNGAEKGLANNPKLRDVNVISILFDKNHYLWAGTIENGLYAKMGKLVRSFDSKDGLSHPTIISLEQDEHGNILAGTYYGYNHLKAPLYKPNAYLPGIDINASSIWSIKRDKQNNLWIGTENGVFTYSPSPFTDITDKNGIVNSFVISSHRDKNNNIWFGTQHGISKLSRDTFHNYRIVHNGEHYKYYSIASDSENTLYFGSRGLFRMKGMKYEYFGSDDGFTSRPVISILNVDSGQYLGTAGDGAFFFNGETFSKINVPGKEVSDIIIDKFDRLVFASEKGIYFKTGKMFRKVDGSEASTVNVLYQTSTGDLYAGTDKGIAIINPNQMNIRGYMAGMENEQIHDFEEDEKFVWAGSSRRIWKIDPKKLEVEHVGLKHGYKGGGISGKSVVKDKGGIIYWGSLRHLARYNPRTYHRKTDKPSVYIQSLQLFNKEINWPETHVDSMEWDGIAYDGVEPWLDVPRNLMLPYDVNHITLRFNALSLQEGNNPEIRYKLEGFDGGWTEAPESNEITYLNLSPGEYTFHVEARLPGKDWSSAAQYSFEIIPAFWQTGFFSGGMALLGILGLVFGVKLRTRNLTEKKDQLENLVRNRTVELYEQKAEMEKKSIMLEEKNEEIFKSIRYAKRIQQAIIPPEKAFASSFTDAFVLYQPKDIVSGDFYWIEKIDNNQVLFAVADCTGHGVPGAFMSIVGYNGLNKAVNEGRLTEPEKILESLSTTVSNTIRHSGEETSVRDGMDLAICRLKNFRINGSENVQPELEYAGANNPLWIVRKSDAPAPRLLPGFLRIREKSDNYTLYEIKPTKQAIGGAEYLNLKPFTNHTIPLFQGDSIYLFTDGYADTFGGPDNRKFLKKKLGQLIIGNQHLSMTEQKNLLLQSHLSWKGNAEQIDDICVAGVKI